MCVCVWVQDNIFDMISSDFDNRFFGSIKYEKNFTIFVCKKTSIQVKANFLKYTR